MPKACPRGTADVVAEAGVDRCRPPVCPDRQVPRRRGPGTALTAGAAAPGPAETFILKDWGGGECTLQSPGTGKFVTDAGGYYLAASADRVGGWVVQETFRAAPRQRTARCPPAHRHREMGAD